LGKGGDSGGRRFASRGDGLRRKGCGGSKGKEKILRSVFSGSRVWRIFDENAMRRDE
jgi:hypothetical protein